MKVTALKMKVGGVSMVVEDWLAKAIAQYPADKLTAWCDRNGIDTIEITDGRDVVIGRGTQPTNEVTLTVGGVSFTPTPGPGEMYVGYTPEEIAAKKHAEWADGLAYGEEVEADAGLEGWKRVRVVRKERVEGELRIWTQGVGETHALFNRASGIRPVTTKANDRYDVWVNAATGKQSTQLYDWHLIPAREAGTDHPKHEHVYGGDGYVAARMLGKTVALYVDGRVAVDGEMFASTNYIAAKDAEAIAKRDAIIAELTERVRVLTPVERKPERGAGLLTVRPMTRVGG